MYPKKLLTCILVGLEEVYRSVLSPEGGDAAQSIQVCIADPFKSPFLLKQENLPCVWGGIILANILHHMKETCSIGILQMIKFQIFFLPVPLLSGGDNWICVPMSGACTNHLHST